MKNEGVRAVRAHFEGVAAQSNAEFGIRNSEFRTEAMECVLGSPVLTERDGARISAPLFCTEGDRVRFSAPLVYKGSWLLPPFHGDKRLRGSLSALLWVY